MNEFEISPDDPRLTAYVLGELEGDERATIEVALRRSVDLRAALEEIRAATGRIEAALAAEATEPERISPNDPRLTAYALGELAGDGRALIEAELRRSSELRAALEEIRATTDRIKATLATEAAEAELIDPPIPMPVEALAVLPVGEERRIEFPAPVEARGDRRPRRRTGKRIPFPLPYSLAGGLAAACLVVVLLQQGQSSRTSVATTPQVAMVTPSPSQAPKEITETAPAPIESAVVQVTLPMVAEAETAPAEPAPKPMVNGLALLEQVRSELAEDTLQLPEVPPAVRVEPLSTPTGPLISTIGLPPPPIGLPATARTPQFLLAGAADEPASRGQAMLRLPNDDSWIAEQRAAGSEAERARLMNKAKNGERLSAEPSRGNPFGLIASKGRATAPAGPQAHGVRLSSPNLLPFDNAFVATAQVPRSTFRVAVDSSGYARLQRMLQSGVLPGANAVHIEDLLNHFSYRLGEPVGTAGAFAATLEINEAPWAPAHRLVRVALKARANAASSRPVAIARDASFQVDFNPAQVASYRLIGFEGGVRNDEVSGNPSRAGEIDAGYAVTALYEVVSATGAIAIPASLGGTLSSDVLALRVRYTDPASNRAMADEFRLADGDRRFEAASADFKFAAAVAGFGMLLRDSPHKGDVTFERVLQWATDGAGAADSETGRQRNDFIALVRQAQGLRR